MSRRSVKTGSRAGSARTRGGKTPAPKKSEICAACSKPNKSVKTLECSHGFCPACLKTIVKEPDDKNGKSSKASQRGGRKGAAPKEEYECPVCNTPPEPPVPAVDYGECSPCKFEEKTNPASGFCVECCELLCESCCGEHNKFKTIRMHTILKGDQIPKDTGAVARLPLLMLCMIHPDKDLEYYCADHDVMGCGACININHRRCDHVMFIKDVADEPTDRKVVAEAAVELRDIRKNFEDIHRDTGDIIASLENQRNEIRERRETYKNKIMAMLDKLDVSSELEMEEVIQKVAKDMGDDSTTSKEMLSKIDSSVQVLDAAAGHATEQQMFVAGRRSVADRDKYVNLLNNAMGSIQDVQLDFKPDPTLDRLIKSLELFDGRSITSTKTRVNQRQQSKSINNFQPKNGFIERRPQMQQNYLPNNTDDRPPSVYSDEGYTRSIVARQDGLPPIRTNSLMTGSVPDFGSAGIRGSMTELQTNGGRNNMSQSPRRNENDGFYPQARSMPPTPRHYEISRTQHTRARASINPTMYERQMQNQGVLPIIHQRGTQSEPGFNTHDFQPISPRTVGQNTLMNQGLSQPPTVSRADVLAVNRPNMQRRDSIKSIASTKQLDTMSINSTTSSREVPKYIRSDIITQASPIKRRSELNGTLTSFKDRRAVLAGQFNVRLQEDDNTCGLKGVAFLHDGRIAMADYDNHNVKLFDSKLYRGIILRLSSGPWDITVTGQKELAVTLPFESKIQFIAVSDQLKATRFIKMDMDCYGVVCRNQELIVVCNDYLIGPAVQIVSMTGRVKQTIDMDRSGQRILTDPYYLTVTPTGKLIYVSDKDRIVCMDRHGNVTSVYQESSLRNIRGIDLDSEGNLYVCGYMSNNVYQVTMHGIDFRCMVNKDQVWDPWSVKFNEVNGTILVTCDASDTIKVFSLQ